jgi:ABC-2 type transport system ATP-binding protein
LEDFRKNNILLSEKQDYGKMTVRFIHKGNTKVEWISVPPQLEDVFLYEYRDELEGEN